MLHSTHIDTFKWQRTAHVGNCNCWHTLTRTHNERRKERESWRKNARDESMWMICYCCRCCCCCCCRDFYYVCVIVVFLLFGSVRFRIRLFNHASTHIHLFHNHSLQNAFFFVAEKRDYLERRAHTTLFYFVFQLIGRHQHHRLHVRATTIFSLPLSFFPFYFSTTTNTTTKLLINIFFFAVWADSHSIALVWKRVYVLCWCWCWCYVSVCVHCLLVCVCLCRCHHRARIHTDYFCFQHIKFTSHFAKRLTSLALSCNVARGNRAYVCACAYLQTRWEFDW